MPHSSAGRFFLIKNQILPECVDGDVFAESNMSKNVAFFEPETTPTTAYPRSASARRDTLLSIYFGSILGRNRISNS